jgi:hypothetical protein
MMGVDQQFWRTSEARILADLYPKGGAKAVMEKLPHRSAGAIREAARRFGVKKAWSNAEIHILCECYPKGGANAVMKKLPHRSASHIRKAAMRLGVKRMPGWARR